MPRVKERTPELRRRVLAAAVQRLSQDGVAGFTTRAIAADAGTSPQALYELFGDKNGLIREVFFEGFRLLDEALRDVPTSEDPRADLVALAHRYRDFIRVHRVLAQVMFAKPFAEFDPDPAESSAGADVRGLLVDRVRRCVDAGSVVGDPVDISIALVALVQGLAAAEITHRMGSSSEVVDRRWSLALGALLDGLSPHANRSRSR